MNGLKDSNPSYNSVSLGDMLNPYLRSWGWFIFCVIVSLAGAFLYLRYTTPQYAVLSKIKLVDDPASGSELGAFRDLDILSGGGVVQVTDEIEVLNSRSNLIEVVKKLNLNLRLFSQGNILASEIYKNHPIEINFLSPDSLIEKLSLSFTLVVKSPTEFTLQLAGEKAPKQYNFGNAITKSFGKFIVTPNSENIKNIVDSEILVRLSPVSQVAQSYKNRLAINALKGSSIITIALNDPVKEKALDIVNTLIGVYNQRAVDDKQIIADKTFTFINDRIADIYGDLSVVDESEEAYKTSEGITDLGSQANVNMSAVLQSRQELQNAQVQLSTAESMIRVIDETPGFDILPSNMSADGSVSTAIAQYNNLFLRRQSLLRSSSEQNPNIIALDQELRGLRQGIRASLQGVINNLTLQVNNLSRELGRINSQIYAVPEKERFLRDIARKKETTEALYVYLLQKREESQITFASTAPKSHIIEKAYPISSAPVSPKKPMIYLLALAVGLLIPGGIIYLKGLFDNTIHNKLELQKLIGDVPVLAELPKLGRRDKTLVRTADRSVLAESMRILRANLDFMLRAKKKTTSGNVIFVTSSVPGEGKTFTASNLAMIYVKANKKVLLVGGDIRNPKIDQFFSGQNVDKLKRISGNKENKGLTEYLIDDTLIAKDIVNTMLVADQTIDIINSGKLMPNPAELLMNDRLDNLIDEIKNVYDYIIVDTAPMVVVSDTMLMTKFADIVLYVTRANVTNKKVLEFPLKLIEEDKLNNLAFIVNGVREHSLGYGGKYGYGYGKSIKKWWQFT